PVGQPDRATGPGPRRRPADTRLRAGVRWGAADHPALARPRLLQPPVLTGRLRAPGQLLGRARLRRDPAHPPGFQHIAPESRRPAGTAVLAIAGPGHDAHPRPARGNRIRRAATVRTPGPDPGRRGRALA